MKRFLLMMVVAFTAMAASAQVYVGGALNFWHEKESDVTTFKIAPSIGYELSEQWAIGAEIGYEFLKQASKSHVVEVAPYARWAYFNKNIVKLFLDMGFGVSVNKPEDYDGELLWNAGIRPGIAVKLNEHISLLAKLGFLGYEENGAFAGEGEWYKSKGFGLNVDGEHLLFGIEYTF